MKKLLGLIITVTLTNIAACVNVYAIRLELIPQTVSTISSSKETRDIRVLVYFEIPEKIVAENIHLDYARLIFEAEISKEKMGQIEIYPLTVSWKDSGELDWSSTWTKDGGDYSVERAGRPVTIKSDEGEKIIQTDVSYIVKDWLNGKMENYGFIIVPSNLDLAVSDIEYSIYTKNIKLLIHYELE